MKPLQVYLGYDPREADAYDVALYSICQRASVPVNVTPLVLGKPPVSDVLTRPMERRDGKLWCPISEAPCATEFAISRFVVPFIQYEGWALFADCDVLCRGDVAELFALADDRYAVMVVKHDHRTGESFKMAGEPQTYYERKNWSSVVLWNCGHPAHGRLSTAALNSWTGRALHAFRWLRDDEIGSLPIDWNFLVGVNESIRPRYGDGVEGGILHYTLGGPWLPGWNGGPLDDLWLEEQRLLKGEEGVT